MSVCLSPRSRVVHDGRPAEIHTAPAIGATGEEIIGIRYLDVPQWEAVEGFPNMQRPARGSVALVPVAALSV